MKKDKLANGILIAIFLVGLSLLLYPSVSDYINNLYRGREIDEYVHQVAAIDNSEYEEMLQKIYDYNASLLERENPYLLSEEEEAAYWSLLNLSGTGIMGYIELPSLKETMPMFHGVEERVLQVAVGHLEWTSLPAGGESTHCVLSGHRGLPSARLFTDLDLLAVGDVFLLHMLDETLTYEVDQILIVEPEETQDLLIQEGQDLCTLVTCTPYGINSHRLLVRGHRIENLTEAQQLRVTPDARLIEPIAVAPVVAAPMLLALLAMLLWPRKKQDRRNDHDLDETFDDLLRDAADDLQLPFDLPGGGPGSGTPG